MLINHLEMIGFKSFAQKTVLQFLKREDRKTITGVVGPNGSGKSNVFDAIRFVLGEQKMKELRAKKIEDLIFMGSEKKGRIGYCEVALYFEDIENASKEVPFRELKITRKAFRDGTGEYYINDVKVRLQDIAMTLAQCGVGLEGLNLIGQGTVEWIVMQTPRERRKFFEEACGIKTYQLKRDEALRKLSRALQNLREGDMLLQELEPRLRSLTRVVKKLSMRDEIEAKLRASQERYFAQCAHELDESVRRLEKEIDKVQNEKTARETAVKQYEKKFESLLNATDRVSYERFNKAIDELRQEKENYFKKIISLEAVRQSSDTAGVDAAVRFTGTIQILKNDLEACDRALKELLEVDDIDIVREKVREIRNRLDKIFSTFQGGPVRAQKTDNMTNDSAHTEDVLKELKIKIKAIEESIEQKSRELYALYEQEKKSKEQTKTISDQMARARESLYAVSAEYNRLMVEKGKLDARNEDLQKEIRKELKTDRVFFPEDQKQEKVDKELLYGEIQKYKHELYALEEIDPNATKEYEECKTRHDFVSSQVTDLRETKGTLEKIIRELNSDIDEKFKKNFSSIDEKFKEYFKLMFDGGSARLEIVKNELKQTSDEIPATEGVEETATVEEEIGGIEIVANPPGKKIKHIEMLSGGERTLVTLALLFSFIAVSTPPFVVLDEVDASLDESNSSRFARIFKN
ncbi:MAG: AAA family ATPase, partial [Parcubacteria group bacterium]|nr:AAA family ATPase [Parcubacteria group bacterium]